MKKTLAAVVMGAFAAQFALAADQVVAPAPAKADTASSVVKHKKKKKKHGKKSKKSKDAAPADQGAGSTGAPAGDAGAGAPPAGGQ